MSKELEMARELVRMLEERDSNNKQEDATDTSCKVELSTLNSGEIFKIGEHDFIVLEQMPGQTAVISKDLMAEDVRFDEDTRDYRESSLKALIEKDIQPIIENAVGADNIIEHKVDLTSVDGQNEFDTCTCKVRVVNFDEARKYNSLIVNKNLPDWWWTCTPWSTAERGCTYSIAVVSPSGNFGSYSYVGSRGVRPFCILKSNIFVSRGEN